MSRYVPKHLGASTQANPKDKTKTQLKPTVAVKTSIRRSAAEKDGFGGIYGEKAELDDFEAEDSELHDIDDGFYDDIDGNASDFTDTEEISGFTVSVPVRISADISDGAIYEENEEAAEASEKAADKSVSRADEIYMYLQTVLESIVAAFLILTFVLSISMVVGSSMEPTLLENDRVVIMRLFYKPDYGDIIAVWAEGLPNRETGGMGEMIVKRVIGLEGDVIDIDKETGTVYRNGIPLEEDYIKESINKDNLGNADYPVTVDENSVFVLGDNRNHSTDSRYTDNGDGDYYVGCIDLRYIMGKAVFRIYPINRAGVLE